MSQSRLGFILIVIGALAVMSSDQHPLIELLVVLLPIGLVLTLVNKKTSLAVEGRRQKSREWIRQNAPWLPRAFSILFFAFLIVINRNVLDYRQVLAHEQEWKKEACHAFSQSALASTCANLPNSSAFECLKQYSRQALANSPSLLRFLSLAATGRQLATQNGNPSPVLSASVLSQVELELAEYTVVLADAFLKKQDSLLLRFSLLDQIEGPLVAQILRNQVGLEMRKIEAMKSQASASLQSGKITFTSEEIVRSQKALEHLRLISRDLIEATEINPIPLILSDLIPSIRSNNINDSQVQNPFRTCD